MRNWWRAKPWKWDMRGVYNDLRYDGYGRMHSLWLALTFPHIHDDLEDLDGPDGPHNRPTV